MDVIVIMCIGVLAGKFLLPRNLNRWNQILQVVCTLFLIFSMGVLLGSQKYRSVFADTFVMNMTLTRRFLENKKTGKGRK